MNGLTLRINPGEKRKNTMNFAPVTFEKHERIGDENDLIKVFFNASTVDEQLHIIKEILNVNKTDCDTDVVKFLALVFIQTEVKHPVKCFIIRHVTRSDYLQQKFSKNLSQFIESYTKENHGSYHTYVSIVTKIGTCIESFPAGLEAIKLVEMTLAGYLIKCLDCCITILRDVKTLAPTEKNEIFSLAHLALRILLCIIQKVNNENIPKLVSMFMELKLHIKDLLFNEDTPMDTKTLCGIICLTMLNLENELDSWTMILDASKADSYITTLLQNEAAELSLHSAIFTVVPFEKLQSTLIHNKPALICLVTHIKAIGERTSSESIFTLSVTRCIAQLSKQLHRVLDRQLALVVLDLALEFCWTHAEHYMDSVRHLATQALNNIVKCGAKVDDKWLDKVCSRGWGRHKAWCICIGAASEALGQRRSRYVPALTSLATTHAQAVTALETILESDVRECDTRTLYDTWVKPALCHAQNTTDPAQLTILQNLMAKAVKLDADIIHYIVPEIKSLVESSPHQIKSVLMLLHVSRKAGGNKWAELLPPLLLNMAAVHADHDVRILSLALVAECPKSTETFSKVELEFALHFLKYNINTQAPNFRQHMLSLFSKLLKRLGESYRVLKRQTESNINSDKVDYYMCFVDNLRRECFVSLMGGANYTRRTVALQLLVYCQLLSLEGYRWSWCPEFVCRLIERLEDTYDDNRTRARALLAKCPKQLLQGSKFRVSIDLSDVLRQASSLKPTDCVSAAYKLLLLKDKLPEVIMEASPVERALNEPVSFALLTILLERLEAELKECELSIVRAPRYGPLYGTLHCMRQVLRDLDPKSISHDEQWSDLIRAMISAGGRASGVAGGVVNNSSPEGHLPMDQGLILTDHGNSGGILLEDGRAVTAQMLLLCAWRTVKEVSLLLGSIVSRLSIQGEGGQEGLLSPQQVLDIGEHFSTLLAETKHRGAFEQAYVGFTEFLARIWQCRSPGLYTWGRARLAQLLGQLTPQRQYQRQHPTRRSAGLPFMIQALVITELQVKGNPTCLHECMATLLRLARDSTETNCTGKYALKHLKNTNSEPNSCDKKPNSDSESSCVMLEDDEDKSQAEVASISIGSSVETRAHCMNILRALFRNSALEESVSGYVGEGLVVALEGFNKDTWMERNAATLLFSALISRAFGASRHRERMTARIFFLRYPALFDYILDRLQSVGPTIEVDLNPGLFPVLVLVSKLYPSSVEGMQCSLRLTSLSPHRNEAGKSPSLYARVAASVDCVAPTRYTPHMIALLNTISSSTIKRNHCHGTLLQLNKLLTSTPENLVVEHEDQLRIRRGVSDSYWILEQATKGIPCYIIADEYVKMVNLIVWRLPTLIDQGMLETVKDYLDRILFVKDIPLITLGREICLANIAYLYIIILSKRCKQHSIEQRMNSLTTEDIVPECTDHRLTNSTCQLSKCNHTTDIMEFIYKCFSHKSYEVVLTCLNYLLILYKKLEIECHFQEHLSTLNINENVLIVLRKNYAFATELCKVLETNKYMECIQKTLSILSLGEGTQKYIVEMKIGRKPTSDDEIVSILLYCIRNEHENYTHTYLESMRHFVKCSLQSNSQCSLSEDLILEVVRMIFDCCTSQNNDSTREVAVTFLQDNFSVLIKMEFESLSEEQKFEMSATLYATLVALLEDDDADIRRTAANAASVVYGHDRDGWPVVAAQAAERLRGSIEEPAMLIVLALMDFRCEVYLTDELSDECRVFDQNERYNIFLEETVWTRECADRLLEICHDKEDVIAFVRSIINDLTYCGTIHKLCNNNVIIFKEMIENSEVIHKNDTTNPKIELFVNKLLCKESI